MITIKIREWVPIGGVTHTATSYQVSTNVGFTNIVDNNPNDTTNLSVYYSPIIVPLNTTYYVRVMRHYSDGTSDAWGNTIPVKNTTDNAGVLVYEPVKVYQPVVTVDMVGLEDPASVNYQVSTSDYAGVGEGHGYTVWMVLNDKNEIISYNKSTTDLTSILLPKTLDTLLATKYIKVIAIHGTHSGIESPVGEVVKVISTAEFTISTTSSIVSPGIDTPVSIQRDLLALNHVVTKVVLRDLNGADVWEIVIQNTDVEVIVPGILLTDNTRYLLVAYGSPATESNSYTIPLQVRSVTAIGNIDRSYKYRKTVTASLPTNRYPYAGPLRSTELFNSRLLLQYLQAVGTNSINQDGTFTPPSLRMGGTYYLPNPYNAYLRVLSRDRIMSSYQDGSINRIIIYNVDYYNNTAVYMYESSILAEPYTNNNGIVMTTQDEYYSVTPGNTIMSKHVMGASSISTSNLSLPANEVSFVTIAKDSGNNLLVFCTDATKIYSYDINNDTYTEKYTLPIEFRGRSLKQETLVNGDVVIWKPVRTEVVNGVSVTDNVLDMLYIDNTNNVCEHIVPLTGLNANVTGSIIMNSGKLLLITDAPTGSNVLTFE